MDRALPGVFNAAGLMVPEPSIMPPPIPLFIDVDTGCEAEYMTTNGLGSVTVAKGRRTDLAGARKRPLQVCGGRP